MPIKDVQQRRAYFKSYMKRRRSLQQVKPTMNQEADPPLNPNASMIDWSAPYSLESRYPYPAWLVQNGRWYDPETGDLVGPAR